MFAEIEKTMSAPEAAEYLGLAPSTLAKARLNGSGPPYLKLGRRVRYRVSDVMRWQADKVVSSTSEAEDRLPKSLTSTGRRP